RVDRTQSDSGQHDSCKAVGEWSRWPPHRCQYGGRMGTRAERFPLIDALRAMAAIAVFGTHAAFFAGAEYDGSALGHYTERLEVGVAVFFVISGFLLYRPFLVARLERVARPATGAYAWRRFLRIVPAYWVALTFSTWWLHKNGVWTASGFPTFYGLGQSFRES